ncbi:hypothetical protein Sru01_62020 [Sphaerisporangium rufum]|uniref:Uncharacterized protein n=1 Tax=Sphaerisporangium rufum TaxID=1381558 RepID=A0A919RAL2_9ACTN|nr:hypothetical protein Sru01_62020 [Sphaerisporangium rufum]
MRRPPPGGRAGVAERSGSGGVEPVPFQKKAFVPRLRSGKDGEKRPEPDPHGHVDTNVWCPMNSTYVEQHSMISIGFFPG